MIVTAADFSFDAPGGVQAGLTGIALSNTGAEPHQAQIAAIRAGKSLADVTAALQRQDINALTGIIEFAGGPNTVAPGHSQYVVADLKPGPHLFLCFVAGADGVPHVAKGMLRAFTVLPPVSTQRAPAVTDRPILLRDFAISVPPLLRAGVHTFTVLNAGPQPHEIDLVKLAPGKSYQDMLAFFTSGTGPPPFAIAGGLAATTPGEQAFVTLPLETGDYVALCNVPDAATGKSHAQLGMVIQFTVK
jgi:uncharacterized cupredoxin-like copper-binding protein